MARWSRSRSTALLLDGRQYRQRPVGRPAAYMISQQGDKLKNDEGRSLKAREDEKYSKQDCCFADGDRRCHPTVSRIMARQYA